MILVFYEIGKLRVDLLDPSNIQAVIEMDDIDSIFHEFNMKLHKHWFSPFGPERRFFCGNSPTDAKPADRLQAERSLAQRFRTDETRV